MFILIIYNFIPIFKKQKMHIYIDDIAIRKLIIFTNKLRATFVSIILFVQLVKHIEI